MGLRSRRERGRSQQARVIMEVFLEEGVGLEAALWLLVWESGQLGSTPFSRGQ